MNSKLYLNVSALLLSLQLFGTLSVESTAKENYKHKILSVISAVSKVATGAALAVGAHIATELPIVCMHELGHASAHWLYCFDQDIEFKGKIVIYNKFDKNFMSLLVPFEGFFRSEFGYEEKHTNLGEILILVAGPITGILAAYCFIIAVRKIAARFTDDQEARTAQGVFTSPVSIYRDIALEIESLLKNGFSYRSPTILGTFITLFTLLKSGKMCGEFLYGFTPFSLNKNGHMGDGARIWYCLGLKNDLSISPHTTAFVALIPTLTSLGYGFCRAIGLRMF